MNRLRQEKDIQFTIIINNKIKKIITTSCVTAHWVKKSRLARIRRRKQRKKLQQKHTRNSDKFEMKDGCSSRRDDELIATRHIRFDTQLTPEFGCRFVHHSSLRRRWAISKTLKMPYQLLYVVGAIEPIDNIDFYFCAKILMTQFPIGVNHATQLSAENAKYT